MTLLGKLFRPWDPSNEEKVVLFEKVKKTSLKDDEIRLSNGNSSSTSSTIPQSSRSLHKCINESSQPPLLNGKNVKKNQLVHDKAMINGLVNFKNEKPSAAKVSKIKSSHETSFESQLLLQNEIQSEKRRAEEAHSMLTNSQEMYLTNSSISNCCEPISPAEFDIYYNGSNCSSNMFLYPNSNTINELASLSRHELTAMGLLPPEPTSSHKIRRQRPKRFHCPHCQVAFSNNGQLRGHIRIHTGERPYICEEEGCGKSFTRNEELTRHRRIHSGLRPFPCSYCGKKFGRKDHLKKHTRTHQRGVYNPRTTSLIGYANPFQPFHQNLLSSSTFATPNELINLQSQYSSSFSQHSQLLLPSITSTTASLSSPGPFNLNIHSSHHSHPHQLPSLINNKFNTHL